MVAHSVSFDYVHGRPEEALDFVQMECLDRHGVVTLGPTQLDAVLLDEVDVLWPRIDECDVLTGATEVAANVATYGAGSHEHDSFAHEVSFRTARLW